jgi:hypothetical protein
VVLGLFVASWISQRFSATLILFLISDLSSSRLALSNLGRDFLDLASSRDFSGCFDLGPFSLVFWLTWLSPFIELRNREKDKGSREREKYYLIPKTDEQLLLELGELLFISF